MTPEPTRRLAAVWFADIVGYADLAARDEALALRVVGELERIARLQCDARGGRVAKLMGEGILTVFDSADGAVRAGVALRDGFLDSSDVRKAGVSLCIGLHLGDVAESVDGEIYGDAVNAASRIAEVAEAGQVAISSVAYQLLQQRATLEVEDLGEHDLTGIGPVRLHAVSIPDATEGGHIRELLQDELAPLQVLDEAGFGGMGAIYLVRDPRLRRALAVKVLREELVADKQARARFFREAQIIAGLAHPNVISIHSVGELRDGTPYFVMDYIEGGSLADRIESDGPLPVREVRRIVGEVASALAAAHAKGVVHRDIKASNILYDSAMGRVLVTDWGIAALGGSVELPPETRLTTVGAVIGSPRYMSPEQLAGDEVGPESDIYSLGLLAFELLTGEGPFPARTPRGLMVAHLHEESPRLSDVREGVDPEFDSAVSQCLAKIPGERVTAEELANRFAPGAGAMLEWPPPGLEPLRGALFQFQIGWGLLSVGVSAPVLLALLARSSSGFYWQNLLSGTAGVKVLFGVVIALYGLGAAALFIGNRQGIVVERIGTKSTSTQAITMDPAVRAWSLGYGWRTLFEVALDRWGDLGNLLSGQREYSMLSAEERARIRGRHVRRAGLITLVVLSFPFSVITLAAAISSNWLAPRPAIILFVGVPLLLWIVFLVLPTDPGEVRRARSAFARGADSEGVMQSEVEAWQDAREKVTRGVGPRPGRPTSRTWYWASVAAQLVVLAVPLAFGLSVLLGLTISSVRSLPRLTYADLYDRVPPTAHLRLDPDGRTSPAEAARLLMSFADVGSQDAALRSGDVDFGNRLISRAIVGLGVAEMAGLRSLTEDPRAESFSRVARADGIEGAPPEAFTESTIFGEHEPRTFPGLEDAARSRVGAAVYLLASDRVEEAEEILREVYSVGYLLVTESNDTREATSGMRLVVMALSALEQLFTGTDRFQQASALAATPRSLPVTGWTDWVERARDLIGDATQPRSVRIATMHDLLTASECHTLQGLVLGRPADIDEEVATTAAALVRDPSDRAFIDMATSATRRVRRAIDDRTLSEFSVEQDPSAVVYALLRFGGKLTGNPRLDACAAMATR